MEVELPSETQQIDRVLQAFADRYHECNPFIYQDSGREKSFLYMKSVLTASRSSILCCVLFDYATHRLL